MRPIFNFLETMLRCTYYLLYSILLGLRGQRYMEEVTKTIADAPRPSQVAESSCDVGIQSRTIIGESYSWKRKKPKFVWS